MSLPPRPSAAASPGQAAVQQKTAPGAALQRKEQTELTGQWMTAAMRPDLYGAPVQRKQAGAGDANVQELAAQGVTGSGSTLPYADQIQQSFGRHSIAGVQAHTGGEAAHAASAIGAEAYATGDRVAFSQAPSLHTAAHEAAHVVQQRHGVQLKGGVGQAGDSYEVHADRVADAVVRGESAEALLDEHAGSASAGGQVQQQAVQRFGGQGQPADVADARRRMGDALSTWFTSVTANIVTNRSNGGDASNRFIDFSEGGIDKLRSVGSVTGAVAGIFGTAGAVVGACITALVEVAAASLSNKSQKKAAAARQLDEAARQGRTRAEELRNEAQEMANTTSTLQEYQRGIQHINRLPMADVVPENIIYRDLLLAMAQGGGYNVDGSDWNERNFGRYYRSWDWGNPFGVNGRDIASELNDLAAGDPSVRAHTRINSRSGGTWGSRRPDIVPAQGR